MWEWRDLWEACLRWQRWIGIGLLAGGLLLSLWQMELAWMLWAGFFAVALRGTAIAVYGYRDFRQAQSVKQAVAKVCDGGGMMLVEFSIALIFALALTNHEVPHWPVYTITVGAAVWFVANLIAPSPQPQVRVYMHVTELPKESGEASSPAREPEKPGMLK